jgi:hypothetical protein
MFMKISRLSILAVMVMMIVVATAGCSSKPQVGSNVSYTSITSTNYKWLEYNTTDSVNGVSTSIMANSRIEKSTDSYQGNPAILIKTTSESNDRNLGSISFVSNAYFDTSLKTVLGGTETMTYGNGQPTTIPINVSNASNYSDMRSGIDLSNIMLTYDGPESVTVPSGTYSNADKYTYSTGATKGAISDTLWIATGIPIPVKIIRTNVGYPDTYTDNLVGWG